MKQSLSFCDILTFWKKKKLQLNKTQRPALNPNQSSMLNVFNTGHVTHLFYTKGYNSKNTRNNSINKPFARWQGLIESDTLKQFECLTSLESDVFTDFSKHELARFPAILSHT